MIQITPRFMRLGVAFVSMGALAFFIVGALFHWAWAGFDKPLYDWMQLLIIPIALALIAIWFNRIERKNEQALASDNQQETALQSYLDHMSELLLEKKLRDSKPNDEVRNVARVRTLTMFYQLNTRRANYMLAFLRESGPITADASTSIVSLSKADLSYMDLSGTNFTGVNLSGTYINKANLSRAIFMGANLSGANFSKSNLTNAMLVNANLSRAVFSNADLSKASLEGAKFSGTMFFGTQLTEADFNFAKYCDDSEFRAKLGRVDLSKAYLNGAIIDETSFDEVSLTKEQIETLNVIPSYPRDAQRVNEQEDKHKEISVNPEVNRYKKVQRRSSAKAITGRDSTVKAQRRQIRSYLYGYQQREQQKARARKLIEALGKPNSPPRSDPQM